MFSNRSQCREGELCKAIQVRQLRFGGGGHHTRATTTRRRTPQANSSSTQAKGEPMLKGETRDILFVCIGIIIISGLIEVVYRTL